MQLHKKVCNSNFQKNQSKQGLHFFAIVNCAIQLPKIT